MRSGAKIYGGLLLLLMLGQMFDASLFPHTHFFHGRFIAPIEQGNDAGQPEPCHAQEVLLALMSSTVVSAAMVSVEAAPAPCFGEVFAELCEAFFQSAASRDNCLRGPPATGEEIL